MTAAAEVKKKIYQNWREPNVAAWVIDQLPLLHRGPHFEGSRFRLDLSSGLSLQNHMPSRFDNFSSTPKLVISGGLEGSAGQIASVQEMHNIRAITSSRDESALAVLLEPDEYIRQKGRQPLIELEEREILWSTSGLVDAVITLPIRRTSSAQDHYLRIHDHVKPARWVSNPENPWVMDIVQRGQGPAFDLTLITKHAPRLHTSFLASTQRMTVKETRTALFANLLSMTKQPDLYQTLPEGQGSPYYHAKILFQELSEGL